MCRNVERVLTHAEYRYSTFNSIDSRQIDISIETIIIFFFFQVVIRLGRQRRVTIIRLLADL